MPMICPYCDSQVKDLPDNHVCPHCGAPFADSGKMSLNDYFYRYYPNRVKATKALRKDTGMDLIEAKDLIDELFDSHLQEDHEKDLSVAWKNLKEAAKELWSKD